jgi:erythromycin esterase
LGNPPTAPTSSSRSSTGSCACWSSLEWLRAWNTRHRDKVQFVGADVYDTRRSVYDAVASYVQRVAPRLLPQLVKAVPHGPGDRGHALALQHARQIVAFYEYYTLDQPNYRDQKLAQNLRWWRRHTGDKVVFWAANVHTANARRLVATIPPDVLEFKAAGAYLREHYGSRYASIGFTFDHGAVNSGWGGPAFTPRPFPVPPPPRGFAERPLGEVALPQYLLHLRRPAPPAVRSWLHAPARIRVIGATYDPATTPPTT